MDQCELRREEFIQAELEDGMGWPPQTSMRFQGAGVAAARFWRANICFAAAASRYSST
jgi:hypothetical protein